MPLKFGVQKHENSDPIPDLTANNLGMEQDIVNRKSAFKTADCPLGGDVILFTLVL